MAIAWLLHQDVTSVLIGASSVKQLDDNLQAINHIAFTEEELARIALQ
jgi:L-glyceraldehyde 3-phosphate reductase